MAKIVGRERYGYLSFSLFWNQSAYNNFYQDGTHQPGSLSVVDWLWSLFLIQISYFTLYIHLKVMHSFHSIPWRENEFSVNLNRNCFGFQRRRKKRIYAYSREMIVLGLKDDETEGLWGWNLHESQFGNYYNCCQNLAKIGWRFPH